MNAPIIIIDKSARTITRLNDEGFGLIQYYRHGLTVKIVEYFLRRKGYVHLRDGNRHVYQLVAA